MSKATENRQAAQQRAMAVRPKVGGFPYLAETLRRAGCTRNLGQRGTGQISGEIEWKRGWDRHRGSRPSSPEASEGFREEMNGETTRRAPKHESFWREKGYEHPLKRAVQLPSGISQLIGRTRRSRKTQSLSKQPSAVSAVPVL